MNTTISNPEQHECVLDKSIVLSLNANWLPIGVKTIREAVIALMSESDGEPPLFALDLNVDAEGNLEYANPLSWEAWERLPVRENDLFIQTARKQIRAPLVVICRWYSKVPMRRPRLSNANVLERDGYTCQYSGRKLPRSSLNVDHVVPLDRGGRNTWHNMVACEKGINSRKSNRLNHEAGLKLIRQPEEPKAVPVSFALTEAKHPSWVPFVTRS